MTKKELITAIKNIPDFDECMGMSKERLNEENYAFAFGYLYAFIQNLITQIQDEDESEAKNENYL